MESTTYVLPATPKQIAYARALALRNQTLLPWEVQQDRRSLSAWIDAQAKLTPATALDSLPSSKQVAFAERLARIKRRAVPDECFRDKGLMSKWSDGNKGARHRLAPAFRSFRHTVAWQTERSCQPIGWQISPSGHQPRSNSCPKDQGLRPSATTASRSRLSTQRLQVSHHLGLLHQFFGNGDIGASITLKKQLHRRKL